MSARVRVAAAAVVALGALAGMVALSRHSRADESGVGHLRFAATSPARAPFGHGIADRADAYGQAVSAAIVDYWKGKNA